nr:glycosyltransferase family 4 protein [Pseudorhodoplanes sp.]
MAIAALAGILCAIVIVLLRPLMVRYALARPNARSSHTIPTPQGGGMAIVASTLLMAGSVLAHGGRMSPSEAAAIAAVFGATLLIAILGAIDDIRPIEVIPRLLVQAVAVGIVIAALPAQFQMTPLLPWWLERVMLVFAGLWFVNLVNFMDGLDWMTVAEMVPVTAALALFGMLGALPEAGVVVALALLGALVGFAPFNRPVARLFLGDVGSLPIGLLIGWLLALLANKGHLAAALLLPLYFLLDASVTLLRRLARGERLWQAHRSHFYQLATDNGFSVPQIIARVFAVNIVLAVLAYICIRFNTHAVEIAALVAGLIVVSSLLLRFSMKRS